MGTARCSPHFYVYYCPQGLTFCRCSQEVAAVILQMVASSVSCTHLSWVTKWDFKDRIELPELVTRITRGDRAHQPLERGVQSDKRSANIGNRNRHLDAKAIFPHEVDIDNKSGIHLVDSMLSLRRRFCVFGVCLVPIYRRPETSPRGVGSERK